MNVTSLFSAAALAILALPAVAAQEPKPKPPQVAPTEKGEKAEKAAPAAPAADGAIVLKQRASYPLTTCVACGKPLPAVPVEHVKNARLFRLDAEACAKAVDADAAGFAKKIDEAVIAQQKPTYPMKVSPVSGKPLEATAVDHVHGTRLVRLASQDEVALFEKDPAAAMAKVDAALIEAQLPSYALKTCPVSTEELGPESVNYVYGTKLVRFCCKKCIVSFEKEPGKYSRALAAK